MDIEAIKKRDKAAKAASEFIKANGVNRGGMASDLLESQADVEPLIAEVERLTKELDSARSKNVFSTRSRAW